SHVEEHPTLATAGKRALKGFADLLAELIQATHDRPLPELIDFLLVKTGYAAELRDGTEEGEERWLNVLELRRVAADFAEIEPEVALALFLENVALVGGADTTQTGESGTLADEDRKKDAVTLITLHAAKGLEYPVVFLVGLEEGILPHARSLEDQDELEEERRLAYVGITRAKNRLYLVYAVRRSFYGGDHRYQEPSRFVDEIPRELTEQSRGTGRLEPERAGRTSGRDGRSPATTTFGQGAGRGFAGAPPDSTRDRRSSEFDGSAATSPGIAADGEAEQAAPPAEPSQLKPGDTVIHRLFGRGTVLSVAENGGSTTVEVLFETMGKKALDTAFAKLEKI
ncbi:MAG TPA: ATP-dependent helicase, partial [Ktedonobacterales bacterium]|nr:ATP-dependent helicase [Ktedonobacterales bacterium]